MTKSRRVIERSGRVSRELMQELVAEFRGSGKSKNAFARELGIAWGTLDRWCSVLRGSEEEAGEHSRRSRLKLLPVRVTDRRGRAALEEPESVADAAGALEIVSPGGWRLRVSERVTASRVRELLEIVETLGQC